MPPPNATNLALGTLLEIHIKSPALLELPSLAIGYMYTKRPTMIGSERDHSWDTFLKVLYKPIIHSLRYCPIGYNVRSLVLLISANIFISKTYIYIIIFLTLMYSTFFLIGTFTLFPNTHSNWEGITPQERSTSTIGRQYTWNNYHCHDTHHTDLCPIQTLERTPYSISLHSLELPKGEGIMPQERSYNNFQDLVTIIMIPLQNTNYNTIFSLEATDVWQLNCIYTDTDDP